MNKHTLVIDHELCWGCRTCEVACKQEYDHEVKFIHVQEDGPKMVETSWNMFTVQRCVAIATTLHVLKPARNKPSRREKTAL